MVRRVIVPASAVNRVREILAELQNPPPVVSIDTFRRYALCLRYASFCVALWKRSLAYISATMSLSSATRP